MVSNARKRKRGRKETLSFRDILWSVLILLLVVGAFRDQLRLPSEERTWHGKIAGKIPYDFRPPTMERLRATFWNRNTADILVPQAFGIGWTLNLYPFFYPQTPEQLR